MPILELHLEGHIRKEFNHLPFEAKFVLFRHEKLSLHRRTIENWHRLRRLAVYCQPSVFLFRIRSILEDMFTSIQQKELRIRSLFQGFKTPEEKYKKIIEFGRELSPLKEKGEEHLVRGCQSRVYLVPRWDGRALHFATESDALISAGLAHLLTAVYSGETPETILKHPPTYLKELGILSSLSPGRANGLASMYKRIQQIALATSSHPPEPEHGLAGESPLLERTEQR